MPNSCYHNGSHSWRTSHQVLRPENRAVIGRARCKAASVAALLLCGLAMPSALTAQSAAPAANSGRMDNLLPSDTADQRPAALHMDGFSQTDFAALPSTGSMSKSSRNASAWQAVDGTIPRVRPAAFTQNVRANISDQSGSEASRSVLPPVSDITESTTLQPGDAGPAQGILNRVKVDVDPVTGIITLVGDRADVELVQKAIADLSAKADLSQPLTERVPLKNVLSETIAERVQEIYDDNFLASRGRASITALNHPNSLLVIGQPDAVNAVKDVVRLIDVEADAADATDDFRTFKLKHMSAADAKTRLDSYFGQAGEGSADVQLPAVPIATIVDYRSNSLIVKGSPQSLNQAKRVLDQIDIATSEATNEVRVFQLKNTLAEDMAVVLQDAISGQQANAGQGFNPNQQSQQQQQGNQNVSQLQSQLRSAMLQLRTIDRNGDTIEGGIMFDVRVTADSNSNSLVVTGPSETMDLIAALIEQLDTIPAADTQIKVFQVLNGDAETLLDMLENLFGSANTQQGGFGGGGGGQGTSNLSQLPLQGASATDGATLINLRFSIDPRTNSIIASGPAGDLQVVEDLLNRLDEAEINQRRVFVYRLSNAPALDVSDAINAWLDSRSSVNDEDPRALGGLNQANREVIVVPEVVSNSLIVSVLPQYYGELEEVIRALDRRPPMVKVKVLIAEVDLDSIEEFGVDVGIQDSLLFDRGTISSAAGVIDQTTNGFNFNPGTSSNFNNTDRETLAGQALSSLATGRINSELGYGGLVLSAGNESISVLLRALKNKQCLKVLSKPHIMTIENLQGRVSIGAEVPRITGVTQSNFGVTNDVEFTDVGVILEITPRVSPDGMIVMFVNATKSSVGPEETGIPIFVNQNGDVVRSPQIIATEAQTTVMARSGQTVVFSGLVQEEKSHVVRATPFLSDLPLIGPLFKFESDTASRSELLIIMTPYLVDDEQSMEIQNRDEIDRMHWCLCDVAEVYGNTDYDGGQTSGPDVYYPDMDPAGFNPQIGSVDGTNGMDFDDVRTADQDTRTRADRTLDELKTTSVGGKPEKVSRYQKFRQASRRLKRKMISTSLTDGTSDSNIKQAAWTE